MNCPNIGQSLQGTGPTGKQPRLFPLSVGGVLASSALHRILSNVASRLQTYRVVEDVHRQCRRSPVGKETVEQADIR